MIILHYVADKMIPKIWFLKTRKCAIMSVLLQGKECQELHFDA